MVSLHCFHTEQRQNCFIQIWSNKIYGWVSNHLWTIRPALYSSWAIKQLYVYLVWRGSLMEYSQLLSWRVWYRMGGVERSKKMEGFVYRINLIRRQHLVVVQYLNMHMVFYSGLACMLFNPRQFGFSAMLFNPPPHAPLPIHVPQIPQNHINDLFSDQSWNWSISFPRK